METITVYYSHVISGFHHKYLVYTDANGNSFIAQGGGTIGGIALGNTRVDEMIESLNPWDRPFANCGDSFLNTVNSIIHLKNPIGSPGQARS